MAFFAGAFQLPWEDRRTADRVEETFRGSKSEYKRLGAIVIRATVVIGSEGVGDGKNNGALEICWIFWTFIKSWMDQHL